MDFMRLNTRSFHHQLIRFGQIYIKLLPSIKSYQIIKQICWKNKQWNLISQNLTVKSFSNNEQNELKTGVIYLGWGLKALGSWPLTLLPWKKCFFINRQLFPYNPTTLNYFENKPYLKWHSEFRMGGKPIWWNVTNFTMPLDPWQALRTISYYGLQILPNLQAFIKILTCLCEYHRGRKRDVRKATVYKLPQSLCFLHQIFCKHIRISISPLSFFSQAFRI